MHQSTVLERSSHSVSIYGLGGGLSYTQTVISRLIEMIQSESQRFGQKPIDIKRVMTSTNPGAIQKLHGSALCVVPIANDIGKLVAENCLTIDKILKMGETLHLVGWYSLEVQHVLACLQGDTLENIASIHSHPQAILQCSESLKGLGCKEIIKVENLEDPEKISLAGFNTETDLLICKVQDWKNFESKGFDIVEAEFHSTDKSVKSAPQRYHLISWGLDAGTAKRIMGTPSALEVCQGRISSLNPIILTPEASTTAHMDNGQLRHGQAIITGPQAIEHYREELGLQVLDRDFGPKNNFTHFAVFSNNTRILPGLEDLKKSWKICTIVLENAAREYEIKNLLERARIGIEFEKKEPFAGPSELFTGVIDVGQRNINSLIRKINTLGGNVKII